MDKTTLIYQVKTAAESDILWHLKECNNNFLPPLTDRIDINAYAKKIFDKAVTFEAWENKNLIGLIAAYVNTGNPKISFITNVSVKKEFMGMGIASVLLKKCIAHAADVHCNEIHLEVFKNNIAAINFYKKYNFTQSGTQENSLLMKLEIKK
ncbi:MAG TPA: GNAT family N-acetyltransferase [Ferruginibacter sp.]|nr:GNAT family N-acetyltransferase [Ferruginibacter sp.]